MTSSIPPARPNLSLWNRGRLKDCNSPINPARRYTVRAAPVGNVHLHPLRTALLICRENTPSEFMFSSGGFIHPTRYLELTSLIELRYPYIRTTLSSLTVLASPDFTALNRTIPREPAFLPGRYPTRQGSMAELGQEIVDEEDCSLACCTVPLLSQLGEPLEVGSFGV